MPRCLLLRIAFASLIGLPALSGCVQQNRYDELLTANRSLQEQVIMLQDEAETSNASLQATRSQLNEMRAAYDDLNSKYAMISGDFDALANENDRFMSRITSLEIGPLPIDVENALNELAARHPGLLTFDSSQGMLRFSSDFTFASGSASLKSDAASTLRTLASVLNEDSAGQFEIRVIGHTDSVRVSKPSTRRNHPTNMHLSVHRAISVADQLSSAGVDSNRIQVAGYGPHRPIVENGANGAAANRRVEIFLVPMKEPVADLMPPSYNETIQIDESPVVDETIEPMK